MSYMFNECIYLREILDNPKEKNTQVIFEAKDDFLGYNDQSLLLDDSQINIDEEKYSIYKGNNTLSSSISSITKDNISVFTYFDYCQIKEHYPLIKNVTDMNHMFCGCSYLNSLPEISKWNVSNVKDMSYMIYGCKFLKSLPDLSNLDTSNVKSMRYMFYGCNLLE